MPGVVDGSRSVRHSFHERLICAADPVQDDEIGRGRPSRTTTRLTAAHVAAAGTLRRVSHRLGKRRRRIFPIACKQAVGRRVVLAQCGGELVANSKTAQTAVPNKLREFICFPSLHDKAHLPEATLTIHIGPVFAQRQPIHAAGRFAGIRIAHSNNPVRRKIGWVTQTDFRAGSPLAKFRSRPKPWSWTSRQVRAGCAR